MNHVKKYDFQISIVFYLLVSLILSSFLFNTVHAKKYFYSTESSKIDLNYPATRIVSGDINQDGLSDLAIVQENNNSISIFTNNKGKFIKKTELGTMNRPQDIKLADMDNDGNTDIIVSAHGGSVTIFYQKNGEFNTKKRSGIGKRRHNLAIGDLDQDGDKDVVVVNRDAESITIYLNKNGNLNKLKEKNNYISEPTAIEVSDLNQDSYPELIITDRYKDVVVVENKQQGKDFDNSRQFSTDSETKKTEVADINNNGQKDIVASVRGENGAYFFVNTGNLKFSKKQVKTKIESNPLDFSTIDFNQSSNQDLLFSQDNPSELSFLINEENLNFTKKFLDLNDVSPSLTVEELNNDNREDIALITGSESKQVKVLFRKGTKLELKAKATDNQGEVIATNSHSYQVSGFERTPDNIEINSSTNNIILQADTDIKRRSALEYGFYTTATSSNDVAFGTSSVKRALKQINFTTSSKKQITIPRQSFKQDFYFDAILFVSNGDGYSGVGNKFSKEVDDVVPLKFKVQIKTKHQNEENKTEESEKNNTNIPKKEQNKGNKQKVKKQKNRIEKTTTCPLPTERFYSYPETRSVWKVTDRCTKRPVQSSEVYFTHVDSWNKVNITNKNKIKQIQDDSAGFLPWGSKWDPKNGTIVKTPRKNRVYLILKGKKYWIKSVEVFIKLGYKWGWIQDVSQGFLSKYQLGETIESNSLYPTGTIIKEVNSDKLYKLENQNGRVVRRYIKNMSIFSELGYRKDRIVKVENIQKYKTGTPVATNINQ
ncbi:MAG: FG-GAP repeat domain-containing protein [Candidatus Magasanikbacteria bacterium]